MRVFKATGLRYRINIVSGGEGVYILSGVKEKRQESEIYTIVCVPTTFGRHCLNLIFEEDR